MVARRIIVFKDDFIKFYRSQDYKVQQKIEYTLDLIRFERQIPKKFFKYLEGTDGIYEIRVKTTFKDIRILCFFDVAELVVLTNCFLKKTRKTPRRKIELAERLRREYLWDKNKTHPK